LGTDFSMLLIGTIGTFIPLGPQAKVHLMTQNG
jgi:hypothetical protein